MQTPIERASDIYINLILIMVGEFKYQYQHSR